MANWMADLQDRREVWKSFTAVSLPAVVSSVGKSVCDTGTAPSAALDMLVQEHASTLDGIIDTVSAKHPLPDYLNLLKLNGRLAIVGVPPEPLELPSPSLVFQRRLVGGSLIGGIRETQEMLVRAPPPARLTACRDIQSALCVVRRHAFCLLRNEWHVDMSCSVALGCGGYSPGVQRVLQCCACFNAGDLPAHECRTRLMP